jgi:restriction system protein
MNRLIEAGAPEGWRDLEAHVAKILNECGYDVEVQKNVQLARGDVNIDVWADDHSRPPNVIAVECKHWASAVTKAVVHGFRTVVSDSGANTGLIVASSGFQAGAIEAAAYSNVRLINWSEFQQMFVEHWYRRYMAPRLRETADPLVEYTEPINSRIFRKARTLSEKRREEFEALRAKYLELGLVFIPMYTKIPGRPDGPAIPDLPLRPRYDDDNVNRLPDSVLDAPALRALLDALTEAYGAAIAEFDQVFGERA